MFISIARTRRGSIKTISTYMMNLYHPDLFPYKREFTHVESCLRGQRFSLLVDINTHVGVVFKNTTLGTFNEPLCNRYWQLGNLENLKHIISGGHHLLVNLITVGFSAAEIISSTCCTWDLCVKYDYDVEDAVDRTQVGLTIKWLREHDGVLTWIY